ncbi:MAG TPA: GGDEF domain-containing protein [bacterium]|nr:GGDEF domain-containing protein [bacterium]HPN31702.1 GGDEF domain-containing protein [bacterium]
MKTIHHQLLNDYWQCPYKAKLLISGNVDLQSYYTGSNKYQNFSKSVYKTIQDFYKLQINKRNLEYLKNSLRQNWIREGYSTIEEERQFGMEALEILEKFYYQNDKSRIYNYINHKLKYKIMDSELQSVLQFGEYLAVQNKFIITDFSTSSSYSKHIKDKNDAINDFSVINKILAVYNSFKSDAVIYKRVFLRYGEISEFTADLEIIKEFEEIFRQKIKEFSKEENFARKIGKHCAYCGVGTICQLSDTISYNDNPRFFKLLRFLTELLRAEFSFGALENFIKTNIKSIISGLNNFEILDNAKLSEIFGGEFADYVLMKTETTNLNYIEIDKIFYYFAFIGEYEETNRYLVFYMDKPLDIDYILNLNLLLSYIKIKLDQINFYQMSVNDRLTGLYNHGYYRYISEIEIKRCRQFSKKLGVILFDIDHFKKFNDVYGHQAGDFVLANIGKTFKNCVRKKDMAIRYGGEEFIAICPDITNEELFELAENIRTSIQAAAFVYNDIELKVTISGGIALFPDDSGQILELVRIADERLYFSKNKGRNRISSSNETN